MLDIKLYDKNRLLGFTRTILNERFVAICSSRKDGVLIKLLQVTIFIFGHIIMVMITLHRFG